MHRINELFTGRRVGAIALALLLATSVASAGLLEALPPPECKVLAVFEFDGDLEFGGNNGEDWVDLSIGLEPNGDVVVNGQVVGSYGLCGWTRVEVRVSDGDVYIEVLDDLTGHVHCAHAEPIGGLEFVEATGSAVSLDVE